MHLRVWWKEVDEEKSGVWVGTKHTATLLSGIVIGDGSDGDILVRIDKTGLMGYLLVDNVVKSEWVDKP